MKFDQLIPKLGIVVYEQSDTFYLEKRQMIKTQSGNYKLGTGAPLKRTTLKRLLDVLAKKDFVEMSFKGRMPEEVLYFKMYRDGFKIAWLLPANIQQLNFTKSLKIPSGPACVPHLVFMYDSRNGSIKIGAVKTSKIKDDTLIYKPPFHNMSSTGSLCKGSGKYSSKTRYFEDTMDSVVKGFFGSNFSHHNHNDVAKVNINIMWKKLIKSGERFDNNVLNQMGKTFDEFISGG